ncbi:MAG: hypothetical protein HY586_01620 [Candidatus Omnitrophica bacterium]|nr:hypothetical protein [Candidatus Omnitrophota bacterium]
MGEEIKKGFGVIEEVCSVPLGKGEDLRFREVEVNGQRRGDVRHFLEIKGKMAYTQRRILFPKDKIEAVTKGFIKLRNHFLKSDTE